jgi:hypothetical protein
LALTPVEIRGSFRKRLAKKPPDMRKAVEDAVTQLRKDWKHPGLRTHRIQHKKGVYGARLDGGNRLTFRWEAAEDFAPEPLQPRHPQEAVADKTRYPS